MIETIYWAGREAVQTVTVMMCIADIEDTVQVVQVDPDSEMNPGDEMSTDAFSFTVLQHVAFHGMKSVTLRQFDHGTHTANEIVLHHGDGEADVYLLMTGN